MHVTTFKINKIFAKYTLTNPLGGFQRGPKEYQTLKNIIKAKIYYFPVMFENFIL